MRMLIALACTAATLAAAGAASAADWIVFAAPPTDPPKSVPVPKTAVFDNFYPSVLRVNAGDRVVFATRGLHTVTFLGSHGSDEFLLVVNTAHKYAQLADAARKPFWWAGQPKLEYGTRWLEASGDETVEQGELHNTLISPQLKRPQVALTFPKAGTYRYVCLLHPFMRGTIQVASPGASVPAEAQVTRATGQRLGLDWLNAIKRERRRPPGRTTVFMGVGTSRFSINSFLPARLSVRVGQTVSFVNRSPAEQHDVAFGRPAYLKRLMARTDFVPRRPNDPRNQVSPFLPFGSDPPPVYNYDGHNHGNGLLVPGVTDYMLGQCARCSNGINLPGVTRVTFTQPGIYRYVCLLHAPEMSGTIVVRR
jgi:plastocyanin